MSIPFNFTYKDIQHNASLELTDSFSENTITIAGRNYKILGDEEDVTLLRSHISSLKTSNFENIESFQASLLSIGPHEKTNTIFQKTMSNLPIEENEKNKVKISEIVDKQETFNIHESIHKACELIEAYYIFPDQAKEGIEKIKEKLKLGHYDNIKDAETFGEVFTKDLREIIKDKHFDIVILPLPKETQTLPDEESWISNLQEINFGFDEELPKEKRLLDVPLYILTSEGTFSAAEEFTYDMQVLGRGEVIGETTGGGANPCHLKPLNNEGLHIAIPDEEAINPHTKTNWEGQGVSPNHKVTADQALNKVNELIKSLK